MESWGRNKIAGSYVFRPALIDDIIGAFEYAEYLGYSVCLRGAGRSYGDASINSEEVILDLSRFNKILDWNPNNGVIKIESGVTIEQIWNYTLPDGWWLPVVSGTMFPTLGGALAMNIHGKNNYCMGTLGEHVLKFEIYLPKGEILLCSPTINSEIFYSAISGAGLLGCFLSITIKLKKVYSGLLNVRAYNTQNLNQMLELFENKINDADYLVGWIDGFSKGKNFGRGVVHQANYFEKGEDKNPTQTLRSDMQGLPDSILGVLPKSILWKLMKPFNNNLGIKFINWAKWFSSKILDKGKPFKQSHVAFAFLLDYVPNWKLSYGDYGLIQYQSFVPKDMALKVFTKQLQISQDKKLQPYLAVFKRHRSDKFLLSHGVDGYSLALDYKLTKKNKDKIWQLAHDLNKLVLEAGGKFYFAKDSTLNKNETEKYLGMQTIQKFTYLKNECDPNNILQSDLYRRLFS